MTESIESVQYLDGKKENTGDKLTRIGLCKVKYTNGDVYEGKVDLVITENGDKYVRNGHGRYQYLQGAFYEGEYYGGKKHGNGILTYADGSIYTGNFSYGRKSGKGIIKFPNGDVFEGNFLRDEKHGHGKYTYSSKAVYEGEWFHDEPIKGFWYFPKDHRKSLIVTDKKPMHNPPSLGIIIAGAPASGKGTQCENIKRQYGVIHLSTGDMLRAAVSAGSEIGLQAQELMESGKLVPDEIVIGAIKERLEQDDVRKNGFLLDGFPRTAAQAEALKEIGVNIHCFLMLDVDDDKLVERVTGRRIDPETGTSYHVKYQPPPKEIEDRLIQRADDTEEKIVTRLEQFHTNINSIVDFYSHKLFRVDGGKNPQEVWLDVHDALKMTRPIR